MKDTTRTAIAAILAADDSVPPQAAEDALALLARDGAPAERRIVPFDEAARRLGGVTTRTLRNLRERGRLTFVYSTDAARRALGVEETSLLRAVGG